MNFNCFCKSVNCQKLLRLSCMFHLIIGIIMLYNKRENEIHQKVKVTYSIMLSCGGSL